MFDVSKLLEWLKNQSPTLFLIVSVAIGVLLFGPENLLQQIGLLSVVEQYRSYLGAVFLVSFVGLLASTAVSLQGWVFGALRAKQARKAREARLLKLTSDEKRYLARYLKNDTKTQKFDFTDGTAQGLAHAGIIYRATDMSDSNIWGTYFAYNMQPWAWEYLNANTHLLDPEFSELTKADD